MPRQEIPMGRKLGTQKSKFVSAQTLVNCFSEYDAETQQISLYGGPGIKAWAALTGVGLRGLYMFGDVLLAVAGERLYTITRYGIATDQGNIPGSSPVIIADNGTQAVIVVNPDGYVWNGTTLAQITDADFVSASSVDFIDQYMLFTKPNTGSFFISALADATSYDALDIASAERRPDNLLRVVVDGTEALMFGTTTIEGQYNAGAADFPFSRTQTFVQYGLAGVNAVTRADNTVFWLTDKFTIRALRGGTAQEVSDDALNTKLASWNDLSTVQAFTVFFRGHEFAVFRHNDGCVFLDTKSNVWFERQSYNSSTWLVGCAVYAWGKTLLGDIATGDIYELDESTYSENGVPLVRYIESRTMGPGGSPFTLDGLEIEVAPGVGLVSGQGVDPKVWVQLSRDSGFTFGSRMERSLGARGDRDVRVTWGGFGQFPTHGGVIRFGCSDPVELVVGRAWADVVKDQI